MTGDERGHVIKQRLAKDGWSGTGILDKTDVIIVLAMQLLGDAVDNAKSTDADK